VERLEYVGFSKGGIASYSEDFPEGWGVLEGVHGDGLELETEKKGEVWMKALFLGEGRWDWVAER